MTKSNVTHNEVMIIVIVECLNTFKICLEDIIEHTDIH